MKTVSIKIMDLFKMFSVLVLLSAGMLMVSQEAKAHEPPDPGWVGCNGQWVRPGTCPASGFGNMSGLVPNGVPAGQPFNQVIQGQRVSCTWGEIGVSALVGGAVASLTALAINDLFNTKINRPGAFIAGALTNAVMCHKVVTPQSQTVCRDSRDGRVVDRSFCEKSEERSASTRRPSKGRVCRNSDTGEVVDSSFCIKQDEGSMTTSSTMFARKGPTTYYDVSEKDCNKKGGEHNEDLNRCTVEN